MREFLLVLFAVSAIAAPQPHTIKSHRVNEDADYVYYSDTKSDHTETTRKVRKPKPVEYPASVTLVATNDLPVQVQFAYREIYPNGRIHTNYLYRTKTPRERIKITLPPMPEITTEPPRGKADALRLAKARLRHPDKDKPHNKKTMYRPDRIVSSTVKDKKITHTYESGKKNKETLKHAYTVRVKSVDITIPVKPVKPIKPTKLNK